MSIPGYFCFSLFFVLCSFMPMGLCACLSVNITLLPPVSQTNHLLTRTRPILPSTIATATLPLPSRSCVSGLASVCSIACFAELYILCCCLLVLRCGGVYLPDVWGSIVELYQSGIGAVLSNSPRGNVKAHRKRDMQCVWAMESAGMVICTVVWLRKWLWSQIEWEWLDFLSHSLTVSVMW